MLMSTSYACSYIYPLKPSICVISIVNTCWPLMRTSNVYNYGYTCPWCNFTTIWPAFSLSWDSHNLSMYRPAFFQVDERMIVCTCTYVCVYIKRVSNVYHRLGNVLPIKKCLSVICLFWLISLLQCTDKNDTCPNSTLDPFSDPKLLFDY